MCLFFLYTHGNLLVGKFCYACCCLSTLAETWVPGGLGGVKKRDPAGGHGVRGGGGVGGGEEEGGGVGGCGEGGAGGTAPAADHAGAWPDG